MPECLCKQQSLSIKEHDEVGSVTTVMGGESVVVTFDTSCLRCSLRFANN